jgi:hypothetical protein
MFFEHVRRCLFTINSREAVAGWWPEGTTRTESHLGRCLAADSNAVTARIDADSGTTRQRPQEPAAAQKDQGGHVGIVRSQLPRCPHGGHWLRPSRPLLPRQLRPLLPALRGSGQAAITDPDHRLNAPP